MNPALIAILVFLTLATACLAVGLVLRDLFGARSAAQAGQEAGAPIVIRRPQRNRAEPGAQGPVAGFDRWFLELLEDSGVPLDPASATLLLVFFAALLGGALFLWNEHPVVAGLGAGIGIGLVLLWLVIRRTIRVRRLQDQLPTALEMLARSLRAGQSLDQGIAFIGQQSPEPLAAEFRRCAGQLSLGGAVPSVMRALMGRVKMADMRLFTTTLSVHRQTGGNLAKVLERLATVVRDRLSYRRQLRSVTAAGRFSAIMVSMIGPALFCYLFVFHGHYMHTMLESSLGQSVLIFAAALEVIGLIWTARLLKPHY